jgi:monofunctional glycosyltransferase
MASPARARPRSRIAAKTNWPRRLLKWVLRAILFFVAGSILWVLLYRFVPPPITITMLGDIVQGHSVTKDWMPLSEMDPDMPRAAIGAEDSNFCTHHGFDLNAMQKAFEGNARGRRLRGGSTISQQTAKNAFLWQGRSYARKGLEAWFTLLIETLWTKQRIMEVYLNIAETGIHTYGANAGAMRYFGHDASRLSPIEAARIAAVLPLPAKREAIAPGGATRRYGNAIVRRIAIIRGSGYDRCLR